MASSYAVETADVAHQLAFFIDAAPPLGDFRADVLAGLANPQKSLEPKYLYDERGSAIFDQICDAPEYYPTRTEIGILRANAADIAAKIGPNAAIIEPGAGSSVKIRLLLDALERPALFVAQDISGEHLRAAAEGVARAYPNLSVGAVCSDFTDPTPLPEEHLSGAARRAVFFPGSTIGNFSPSMATRILKGARAALRPDDVLVLGADLKKDPAILVPAYDDAGGVTAAFNLNLLDRMNRELEGDIDVSAFRHRARYNDAHARIEMHLESQRDQHFTVAGETFTMAAGDTIHTENSHKFDRQRLSDLGGSAGFALEHTWTDEGGLFSVSLFRAV